MRKILVSLLIVSILVAVTLAVIAFGRGYRPDFTKRTISSTGLLVATSDPAGAQIFLNGNREKFATNTTLTLPPGWYQVKLTKEGYLPWEKKMRIQGEVVSETRALLFPSTPTLTPLTTTGVIAPTLSPDGMKIAYIISFPTSKAGLPADSVEPKAEAPTSGTKAGLWVLNLTSQPLGFSRDPQLLAQTVSNLDFSAGTFSWSPNSKQILATVGANHYLIDAEKGNTPVSLTYEEWENLVNDWQEETKARERVELATFPQDLTEIATTSGKILAFSPDETKVLYQATASATIPPILKPPPIAANPTLEVRNLTPEALYVYDIKEDKNFEISTRTDSTVLSWFPSSRHLAEVTSDKISILEYDGTNRTTVYSGPFEKFVATIPGGGKLLILTSYNRPGLANLYSINLR